MYYRAYDSRNLARRITESGKPDRLSRHRGVVDSINSDGTVNLTLDGSDVILTSIPRLESAQVAVGDTIETIIDENDVFLIGRLAKTEGMTFRGSVTMEGDILTLIHEVPQIRFQDIDDNISFWLHQNNNLFYLLPDRDGSGSWETPYPFRVNVTNNQFDFWHGGGGTTTRIEATGDVRIGKDLYIGGLLFGWVTGGSIVLDNVNEIRADDGAEGDPSYTFTNSAQTGFWVLSGSIPQLSINGVRHYHWNTNGYTGIGDNQHFLGNASNRWTGVWAADGTINTSDASEKQDIVDSDLGLEFIRALRPRRHRWNWGTRPHYSLIAQEVKQVIDSLGIDFAGFIDPAIDWEYDESDPQLSGEQPGSMGLRYHEFIPPMIKAIQELDARLTALEPVTPGP